MWELILKMVLRNFVLLEKWIANVFSLCFIAIDDRKLFVGGLSWETKEEHLKEYFGKFGTLEKVELKLDPMTGRSRGFAFIVFEDAEPGITHFSQPDIKNNCFAL